jgi:hypothetical protein
MRFGLPLQCPWILWMIYQERFKLDMFSCIVTREKSKTIFGSFKTREMFARDGIFFQYRNVSSTLKKQKVLGRTNRLHSFQYIWSIWYDTDSIGNTASRSYMCFLCRGNPFTELLPSNDKGSQTHKQQCDLISVLSLFWRNKRRLMRSPCCMSVCVPL